jgi:hypothetical protein
MDSLEAIRRAQATRLVSEDGDEVELELARGLLPADIEGLADEVGAPLSRCRTPSTGSFRSHIQVPMNPAEWVLTAPAGSEDGSGSHPSVFSSRRFSASGPAGRCQTRLVTDPEQDRSPSASLSPSA